MSEQDSLIGGRRHAALGFIFVTALLDIMALGIMIPVLPILVKQMVDGDTAVASVWAGIFSSSFGAMQFFCSPITGLLSDRFGRRPILLASIFGLGIDFLFMAFAPTLRWLYLGRLINGATSASFGTANAYVADITAPENRAKAFGMLGAAFGVGFTFGPTLGGFLAEFDIRLPFLVCAGIALCNWLYGYFILPESLAKERRTLKLDWTKANPLGALKLLMASPGLVSLAVIYFIYQLAHMVLPVIFVLYVDERYGWTPLFTGLTLAATGISGIVVQTTLVGPVVKWIGERGALLFGLACGALGFAIYGLAPTGWVYMCGIPVFALMGFAMPGLQGLMTRKVSSHEQGQLQGANSAIGGVSGIVGPSIYGLTFAWALRNDAIVHQPGLPILIAAGLLGVAFLMAFRFAKAPTLAPPTA